MYRSLRHVRSGLLTVGFTTSNGRGESASNEVAQFCVVLSSGISHRNTFFVTPMALAKAKKLSSKCSCAKGIDPSVNQRWLSFARWLSKPWAPTEKEIAAVLSQIVTQTMALLTRAGYVVEEEGRATVATDKEEGVLAPLQAASITYRIAYGPRQGQKLLTLQS